MPEPKSECVDSEQYHNKGANVAVYRALVPIPCYRCQQNIMPGKLFRRSANKNGSTVGIRYSFCRKCEPFEMKPEYRNYRQSGPYESSSIQEDLLLLHEVQNSTYWHKLAKSPVVRIQVNESGNAYFTNELGLPLLRGDVAWIISAAKRYLELYSDLQIQAKWQERMDKS